MAYIKIEENGYQEYPIVDGMSSISDEDFMKLKNGDYIIRNFQIVQNFQKQIDSLKRELEKTDYKAIKFAEGLISVSEYEPIKLQRQAWRDEINRLEEQQ